MTKTIITGTAPDGEGNLWALKPRIIPDGPCVLVVGPDRVGKTTLVQHMSNITKVPAFKCPSEKQIFKQGGRSSLAFDYTLTHFIQQTGYRFISDRAYPCEWVYSRVFKRETDDELLQRIDEAHANLGTKILYVHSIDQPKEEDDLVPSDMYWDVSLMYQTFCGWTNCEVVTVDTSWMLKAFQTGGDISESVAKEVLEMLGMGEDRGL
jgi:energy-coupling factor transporter ATP-binding protein EcfA2